MSSLIGRGTHPTESPPGPSPAPAFTRATVCCGPVETGYRRAGHGDTVVALVARDWPAAASLFPGLARDFRLIVPELEPADGSRGRPHFAAWLTDFLDGLGLSNVTLLADERFGAAALGAALVEPVRVGRLAVVLDAAASDDPPAATDAMLCGSGTRLLVAWMRPDSSSASEIAAALLGGCRMAG
jgi:hypothetical protein